MKKQEISIKDTTKVFIDGKTEARSIALPFRLPDMSSAVIIVTRLKKEDWLPGKEIKSITINYYDKN